MWMCLAFSAHSISFCIYVTELSVYWVCRLRNVCWSPWHDQIKTVPYLSFISTSHNSFGVSFVLPEMWHCIFVLHHIDKYKIPFASETISITTTTNTIISFHFISFLFLPQIILLLLLVSLSYCLSAHSWKQTNFICVSFIVSLKMCAFFSFVLFGNETQKSEICYLIEILTKNSRKTWLPVSTSMPLRSLF